jgi:hypothetical protein
MAYFVGEEIQDYLTVVDNDLPVEGATITVLQAISPTGTFTPVVEEVGDGVYRVTFTPSVEGQHYYLVSANATPTQYFDAYFDVENEALDIRPVSVVGLVGDYGTTLYELVRMCALELSDHRELHASVPGAADGTTFVDEVRLSAIPAKGYKGASFVIAGPNVSDNFWIERRVDSSSEDTTSLTIRPALPAQVQLGDVAWLTNIRSCGAHISTYIEHINMAINRAFPQHLQELASTLADPFDMTDPYITVADDLTHVYRVEYEDASGDVWEIPLASQNRRGLSGWYFDDTTKSLFVSSNYAGMAHGTTVRVLGYGKGGILTDPGDMTGCDANWIVERVASSVIRSTGDQKRLAEASMHTNESKEAMVANITNVQPGTIRIR